MPPLALEEWNQMATGFFAGFPDRSLQIEDEVASGDCVAMRWTWTGTHEGDFMGVPRTGKSVRSAGMGIYQVVDGKIVAEWVFEDLFGIMQQLGDPRPESASMTRPASASQRVHGWTLLSWVGASRQTQSVELLIARNPDPDSSLPYLLRLPIGAGLVFRTKGTWPRTSALYCHPVPSEEWPDEPDFVERLALRSCARRGAAIDVVADRGREQRSQLVFTNARGREMVFWQSPRTRKQARPDVRVPSARAAGIAELEVVVDAHERYPYQFRGQKVRTVSRGLACGDYAITIGEKLVATVERKSLADLVSSLTTGRLRFALGELAAVPRAAVVVEDKFSQIFALTRVRPALVADGLAELQVRWPTIPIVFCETRKLAEEWTYRYLAAAHTWGADELSAIARIGTGEDGLAGAPPQPPPSTAEVRAWARANGFIVPDRGRLRPEIHQAWQDR
jgi:predicted ester cyclase